MIHVSQLPVRVDQHGFPNIAFQLPDGFVYAIRLRCPDDAQSNDEQKTQWTAECQAKRWGQPTFYDTRNGGLWDLRFSSEPLPARHTKLTDYAELDTFCNGLVAPNIEVANSTYGFEVFATTDRDEISDLAPEMIAMVREADRESREGNAARDASLTKLVQSWNEKNNPPLCEAPWPWLRELNEKFAVTQHGDRTMIVEAIYDYALGHERLQWTNTEDFIKRHKHQVVEAPDIKGKVRPVSVGEAWFESQYRRQYTTEVFAPGRELPSNVLNLYRDLAVKPRPGRWDRLLHHLKDVFCNGDPETFTYLLNWLARLFQKPGEPGHVAIVLRGDEGVGKGAFCRLLCRAFGNHSIHIAQSRHLVGNFNSHLDCKVFCFADEAYFAGNPENRGPLFALITEDRLQIEAKRVDVRTTLNCLKVVMATNSDWAIPAGPTSRRFLVLDVSSKCRGDRAYFAALNAEVEAGALEAMIFDLLARDISDFDVTRVPQTAALADQKILSLKGPERWLFEALQNGAMAGVAWQKYGCVVGRGEAHADYQRAARIAGEKRPCDVATWSKRCKAVLKDAWGSYRPAEGGRHYRVSLPSLEMCRKAFESHIGHVLEWDDYDETPQAPPSGAEEVFA